jgi:transcriptional regulator with GAF, ATPase, and Fis domain
VLASVLRTGRPGAPHARSPTAEPREHQQVRRHHRGHDPERHHRGLAASGGKRAEAARRLGMSRVTMLDRMKRLGIS